MEAIPIRKAKKEKRTDYNLMTIGVVLGLMLLIAGVVMATKKVADWGAEHQIVKQRVIDLQVRLPYRIEEIEAPQPEVIIVGTPYEDLTSTEQKIIQVWGDYKTSILAIAIFDCGESRLDPEAVSRTGDLGVAQINWPTWKEEVRKEFGYTATDMFNVDKNLEVAYWIWDRADGKIDGQGNFSPWSGYKNGAYLQCFK
jgi:hypothetical protein